MAESLGPGATFAGCSIEGVAGRGGMGVVYRATQLALQRPVALKVIAPELAVDESFRERFQREAHLAASIDHPNVIPVYEAGELEGMLYLLTRWVDGTDLRTELAHAGRLSPHRAVQLLRPVAAALTAAHRRGLVHRDVKPANVLIAHGETEDEDHVYLTDFGIARRADMESAQRTGVFVGTVDYTAPERFEGGRGGPAADIYSFGCMLFETLTGHVPYDRPSGIPKVYAHMADPIPSARAEVPEVPAGLDAVIAKAMAKRPEDRYTSAAELITELGQELEAPVRTATVPARASEETEVVQPTVAGEATEIAPEATAPATVLPSTTPAVPTPPPVARRPRRSPWTWAAPVIVLSLAGVLIATFSDNPSKPGSYAAAATATTHAGGARLAGTGLRLGRTIALPGPPASVSVGKKNVWISVPDRNQLVRSNLTTGKRDVFSASGHPGALTAGFAALWVAEPQSHALAQFIGDTGQHVGSTKLPGSPSAVVFAQNDGSAWVADSSGAITHVAPGGAVTGAPARSTPPATSLAWGEGWLWATNGAASGLLRVSLSTGGATSSFRAGQRPVSVTLDRGVWTANADGHVVRFNPRTLQVNADVAVAPAALDAIAATDPGPFVWAISRTRKVLYRLTNTSSPKVTGKVAFSSLPVALAVTATAVWVATDNDRVTEIRYQ